MRRFMLALGITAVLVSVAVPAGATTVYNESSSAKVVDASWSSDDGSWGYASAWAYRGETPVMNVYQESGTWVSCRDWEAFKGTVTYGFGPATVRFGSNYSTGHATATLDLYSYTDNKPCDNKYPEPVVETVDVMIHLTATSPLIREKGSGSFHVPSEFNDNYRFSSSYRWGEGSVAVGDMELEVWGSLGTTSWRYHSNS